MPVRILQVESEPQQLDAIDSYNSYCARRWERRNFSENCDSEPAGIHSGEALLERILVERRGYKAIIDAYPDYRAERER